MTKYQTPEAVTRQLYEEVSRLKAINAELVASIQKPVQADTSQIMSNGIKPNNSLVQAARQALEALAGMLAIVDDSQAVAGYHLNGELEPWEGFPEVEEVRAAITALREALDAAPQPTAVAQEPVAFLHPKYGHMQRNTEHIAAAGIDYVGAGWLPLYAAPQPARQPLTDDWIRGLCKESWVFDAAKQWIRIAERAHGIGGEA